MDGEKAPVPNVGDGESALSKGLENIENIYDECLQSLYQVRHTILSPSDSSWNDNYQKFRLGVNETENLVEKVLNEAFETVTSVKEGVEILDVFYQYTPRQRIRQVYEGKIERVYRKFNKQLQQVRRNLSMNNPIGLLDQPVYAGKNIWLNNLKTKINSTVNILQSASWFSVYGIMSVSKAEYKGVQEIILTQIQNVHKQWNKSIDKNASKKLETSLLNANLHLQGTMDINFDRNLLKTIKEIVIWTSYEHGVPGHIKAVYAKIGQNIILLRKMTKIVQDYNQIMTSLSVEEKGLFKEKIRKIDRFLWIGKNQHTWMNTDLKDWILTCTDITKTTFDDIQKYKTINGNVQKLCVSIETLEMIDIASTEIVSGDSFKAHQMAYIEEVQRNISEKYEKVKTSTSKLHDSFSKSGTLVQVQWTKYEDKIDERVAMAIRNGILSSLVKLAEAISSSGKTGVAPMMKIKVQLRDSMIHISPKLSNIVDIFNVTQSTLVNVAKNIGKHNEKWQKLITDVIEKNTEFQEIHENILNDIKITISEVEEYLKTWDIYKDTWELNSDKLKQLYLQTNPETTAFDSDVAKYKYLSKSCKKHEAVVWIGFILIDCSSLQEGVIQQCEKWQDIFMDMMKDMVKNELQQLYTFTGESRDCLKEHPSDVYELKDALKHHSTITNQISCLEKQFDVIRQLTGIIHKYKRDLDIQDSARLNNLNENWETFKEFVSESGINLQSFREKSKEELTSKAQDFERHVKNIIEEYTLSGPFGAAWKVDEAFKQLEELNDKINELSVADKSISDGLAIFMIKRPMSKDLGELTKKIELLYKVWGMAEEWEKVHQIWQMSKIVEVSQDEMQESIDSVSNRILTFNEKDIDNRWEIFFQISNQIQSYERIKALISLLVNNALRDRHWSDIFVIIRDMQPNAEEIKLEPQNITIKDLSTYGFDKCITSIEEVVHSAKKEIEIENSLQDLTTLVRESHIVVDVNKQDFFCIKNIMELFSIYKESHERLRILKLSKYISPFLVLVEELDKDISIILTLLEKLECSEKIVLEVKDLFAVFCMKKQLPSPYRILSDTIEFWMDVIAHLQNDPRIYKFSEQKNLTDGLGNMILSLKNIRKSLGSFLLFRRVQYDRLFILTDEEMLSLFACKTTEEISLYIQRLYPNISKVIGSTKRDGSMLIQKLLTHDGEIIPYTTTFKERETIENTVAKIGEILTQHVKTQILSCFQAMRKNSKYEQVVREFSLQAYEVARRIIVTTELTKLFETAVGSDQNNKLLDIIKKIDENMEKLCKLKSSATAQKQKQKFLNMNNVECSIKICLVRMQRYQYLNYIQNCQTLPEWFAFFKFSYIKVKDEIVIVHGYQTYLYGYECLKMGDPMVQTPYLNDTFLEISCASKSKKCVLLHGSPGDGISSGIEIFSNMLGKHIFQCQLDPDIKKTHIEKLFRMLSSKSFVIHILQRTFDQELLTTLSHSFDMLKYSSNEQCMNLFITFHQIGNTSFRISGDLRKSFRPIHFRRERMERLIDTKLIVENFNAFELLRAKMLILIRGFNGVFYEAGKEITNTDILHVIDNAILLMKQDKNMLQEESILQSFWQCFESVSKYELSFPLHKAVKDLYPRLEIKLTDKSKDENIIEKSKEYLSLKNFPHSEDIISKIYEVWKKVTTSSTVIIIGSSSKFKTFIINAVVYILEQLESDIGRFSLESQFQENFLTLKQFGEELGIIPTSLGGDSVAFNKSVILYFDGAVSSSATSLINNLTKKSFPICYTDDERLSVGKNVKIILETSHLTVDEYNEFHNCAIVEISDIGLKEFELLERKLALIWEKGEYFEEFKVKSWKYLTQFISFLNKSLSPLITENSLGIENNFLNILEGLIAIVFDEDTRWKTNIKCIGKLAFFCSLWAVFPTLSREDEEKVDDFIRKNVTDVPVHGTVFDFHIEKETLTWEHWQKNIKEWKYSSGLPHSSIYIQTDSYIKNQYFFNLLLHQGKNVLLVGPKGSGKSSIVTEYIKNFSRLDYHIVSIQVCKNTTPAHVFESIAKFTEMKSMNEVQPIGGKKLLLYLDDVNLDEQNSLGQAIKFFWENKCWLIKGKRVYISDIVILATETMDTSISPRYVTSSRKYFQYFILDKPSEEDIIGIYKTILTGKFMDFEVNIKFLILSMIKGTIGAFNGIKEHFKNDQKISIQFYLNDIKKVIFGVLRSHKDCHDTKFEVVQLWVNEVLRTFRDRMMDLTSENVVVDIVRKQTQKVFNLSFDSVCENEEINEPPMFGNILDTYGFYTDLDGDEVIEFLNAKVVDYNKDDENPRLTLIFNDFIIQNIVKMLRVISEPEGHVIMSGQSGKCRQSIIRLSAFIYQMKLIILGERDVTEKFIWKESMRSLLRVAGLENKPTLLYIALGDKDCSEFLCTLSTIMSFGMDITMFGKHEVSAIEKRKKNNDDPDNLKFSNISRNVLNNLHVVFSLDLADSNIVSYFKEFNFLLSKVIINHMKPMKEDNYRQMVEIFLNENLKTDLVILPETLPILLSTIYLRAKANVIRIMNFDTLNSGTFHFFLSSFVNILTKKLDDRKLLQDKYSQTFDNIVQLETYIENLHTEVSLSKKDLQEAQKVHDDLQVQKMQFKRDYQDIQKKLSDEQKKASDEKNNIAQLENSLRIELEELWSPVERSKLQLAELTQTDISEVFEIEYPDNKLAFMKATMLLLSEEQELNPESLWKIVKQMLNLSNTNLPDTKLLPFMDFLAKNKPKQEIVLMVEEDFIMETIKLWCVAVEAYGRGKKSSNQKRQKCEQLKKRFDTRQDSLRQIRQEAISLDSDMETLEENSAEQLAIIDSGSKNIEIIDAKIEKAEKVKKFLEGVLKDIKGHYSNYKVDNDLIIGNSILSSAVNAFSPPFTSDERKNLMQEWKKLLQAEDVQFSHDLDHIVFGHGQESKAQFINKNIATSGILLENHFLLKSLNQNNVIICIDPDDQALPILSAVEEGSGVLVAHIDDKHLRKNMIHTLARGETLIIRNAEERYENLVLPITRKVFKKDNKTIYIKVFGNLCHFDSNFKIRILVSDRKYVRFSSNATVINFQHVHSDYTSIFFSKISMKKASTIHNQKNEMYSLKESATEVRKCSKEKLLSILSAPMDDLLCDEKIIDKVNEIQETISNSEEKLEVYTSNYSAATESLEPYETLAGFCSKLFLDTIAMKQIRPVYCMSLQSFSQLIDVREEEEAEEDTGSQMSGSYGLLQMSEDEHCILKNILSKLELMMTFVHFSVAALKFTVSIALQKNLIQNNTINDFIKHIKKLEEGDHQDKLSALEPFLSQAESRVVNTIVETSQDKTIFDEIQQYSELSFLQKIGVLAVYKEHGLQNDLLSLFEQTLEITMKGNEKNYLYKGHTFANNKKL